MCERWHIPPSQYAGGPPLWDAADRAILSAWVRLNERTCSMCGRPWAVHATDQVSDYTPGYLSCTAAVAIDSARSRFQGTDAYQQASEAGRNLDAGKLWTAWTTAEGPPDFSGD